MNYKKTLHYLSFAILLISIVFLNYFIYDALVIQPKSSDITLVLLAIGVLNIILFYSIFLNIRESNKVEELSNLSSSHEFVANVTHELRTPLTGILGFVSILKETKLDEEQQEFIGTIEKSSNNLLRLVNDILDHSKASNGKIEIDDHSFDLLESIEESIEGYITKVAEKYIELGLHIDPTLPRNLVGDSTKISQVMLNLLSNAIKFTPEHGLVNISIVKLQEDSQSIDIKFSVKDSGIGISSDKIEKIFEAFSQADSSTNREFGGTGLGLSISSSFVEIMGGKLEIESIENKGTTFFFTLNLKKEALIKERKYIDLKQKSIGYVIPRDNETYKVIDENLEYYIKRTNAKYRTYYQDEIFDLREEELPNTLFINHRYSLDEGVIDRFLTLKTKIVLISCADAEKITTLYKKSIDNFVFKPINYSKTIKALSVNEKKVNEKQEKNANLSRDILVAEDNVINQKLIKHLLVNMNMNVTLANNGLEAFELYKKNSYTMILMDMQMPIMSGVEATKEILAYEKKLGLKHTPIIAATANDSSEHIEEYLKIGMDGFIGKPINLQKLQSIINEHSQYPKSQKKTILLYKDNSLTTKIYTSILEELGYVVDACFEKETFVEKFSTKIYSMALFDTDTFDNNKETTFICNLAKTSTIPSFAFSNNSEYKNCSTLISPEVYGKDLQQTLEHLDEMV